jgi:hypothetical protein
MTERGRPSRSVFRGSSDYQCPHGEREAAVNQRYEKSRQYVGVDLHRRRTTGLLALRVDPLTSVRPTSAAPARPSTAYTVDKHSSVRNADMSGGRATRGPIPRPRCCPQRGLASPNRNANS